MQILGVDVLYILGATVGWLTLSYLFWLFVARPMFKKWVKSTILNMILAPDQDTKAAIEGLFGLGWTWFITPVKTGRITKQKDPESGEEVEIKEELSPYQQIITESAKLIFARFKGQTGGLKASLNQDLSGLVEGNPLGLSPAATKALMKGQIGPAIAEIGLPKLLEHFNKVKGDTGTGGKW